MKWNRNDTFLRSPRSEDVRSLQDLREDPLVGVMTLGRLFPASTVGPSSWLESFNNGTFPTRIGWVITTNGDDVAGFVQIDEIDWISRTCWFGIWVGRPHQGQGHATNATKIVVELAHTRFGLLQVRLRVAATNHTAIRIYEKAGFAEEGRLERAIQTAAGREDVLIMCHNL